MPRWRALNDRLSRPRSLDDKLQVTAISLDLPLCGVGTRLAILGSLLFATLAVTAILDRCLREALLRVHQARNLCGDVADSAAVT